MSTQAFEVLVLPIKGSGADTLLFKHPQVVRVMDYPMNNILSCLNRAKSVFFVGSKCLETQFLILVWPWYRKLMAQAESPNYLYIGHSFGHPISDVKTHAV